MYRVSDHCQPRGDRLCVLWLWWRSSIDIITLLTECQNYRNIREEFFWRTLPQFQSLSEKEKRGVSRGKDRKNSWLLNVSLPANTKEPTCRILTYRQIHIHTYTCTYHILLTATVSIFVCLFVVMLLFMAVLYNPYYSHLTLLFYQ